MTHNTRQLTAEYVAEILAYVQENQIEWAGRSVACPVCGAISRLQVNDDSSCRVDCCGTCGVGWESRLDGGDLTPLTEGELYPGIQHAGRIMGVTGCSECGQNIGHKLSCIMR